MQSVGWIKEYSDGSTYRVGFGGSASLDPPYNSNCERTDLLRSYLDLTYTYGAQKEISGTLTGDPTDYAGVSGPFAQFGQNIGVYQKH